MVTLHETQPPIIHDQLLTISLKALEKSHVTTRIAILIQFLYMMIIHVLNGGAEYLLFTWGV